MNSKNIKFKKVVDAVDVYQRVITRRTITRRRIVTIFSNIFLEFVLHRFVFFCAKTVIYFSATNFGDVKQTYERVTCDRRPEDFGEQILTLGEMRWEAASRHAVWPPLLVAI